MLDYARHTAAAADLLRELPDPMGVAVTEDGASIMMPSDDRVWYEVGEIARGRGLTTARVKPPHCAFGRRYQRHEVEFLRFGVPVVVFRVLDIGPAPRPEIP